MKTVLIVLCGMFVAALTEVTTDENGEKPLRELMEMYCSIGNKELREKFVKECRLVQPDWYKTIVIT